MGIRNSFTAIEISCLIAHDDKVVLLSAISAATNFNMFANPTFAGCEVVLLLVLIPGTDCKCWGRLKVLGGRLFFNHGKPLCFFVFSWTSKKVFRKLSQVILENLHCFACSWR